MQIGQNYPLRAILRCISFAQFVVSVATHVCKLCQFQKSARGVCEIVCEREIERERERESVYSAKELFTRRWEEDGHPQVICAEQ